MASFNLLFPIKMKSLLSCFIVCIFPQLITSLQCYSCSVHCQNPIKTTKCRNTTTFCFEYFDGLNVYRNCLEHNRKCNEDECRKCDKDLCNLDEGGPTCWRCVGEKCKKPKEGKCAKGQKCLIETSAFGVVSKGCGFEEHVCDEGHCDFCEGDLCNTGGGHINEYDDDEEDEEGHENKGEKKKKKKIKNNNQRLHTSRKLFGIMVSFYLIL